MQHYISVSFQLRLTSYPLLLREKIDDIDLGLEDHLIFLMMKGTLDILQLV